MSTDKYYFLKLSARDIPSRTHILICITILDRIFKIDRFDLLVSQNSETSSISINDTYRDCMNKIQKLTLGGQFSQSSTISLTNALNNQFAMENFLVEFMHYVQNRDNLKLRSILEPTIHKVLGRAEYDYICHVEQVTQEELEGSSTSTQVDEGLKKSPYSSVPDGSTIINYQFVLSPVGGTVANELRIGDKILIKITKDSPASESAINSMKLKGENGQILPCPGEVVDIIKKEKNAIQFIVKISDNLYGTYLEEESKVKVKMAEQSAVARDEKFIKDKVAQSEGGLLLPAIVAVVVLVIVWVLVITFV